MPRKPRIDLPGFHHVINRGVNRQNIFLCDADKAQFLEFLDAARKTYHLTIHSYCILNNHYHLLIETRQNNLSLAIRFINSQYAIYFNKKEDRIGPLWQGRFKAWYIYDDLYLQMVIRYIEMNPVKIGLSKSVGEYRFSSTWGAVHPQYAILLSGSLLYRENVQDWLKPLSEKDLRDLSKYKTAVLEKESNQVVRKQQLALIEYFAAADSIEKRNDAVWRAFDSGYKQGDIARYLNLSAVAVSRIVGSERTKRELFTRMKTKGLLWSYAAELEYDWNKAGLLIETVLKYAGLADLKILLELFGIKTIRRIWEGRVKNDSRFVRLNYFLARILFRLDMEANEVADVKHARAEKFRQLAG